MLEQIVHLWGQPRRSGKLGVVTFKPHRFSGIGSDRRSVL
jgi:hypothetical protein